MNTVLKRATSLYFGASGRSGVRAPSGTSTAFQRGATLGLFYQLPLVPSVVYISPIDLKFIAMAEKLFAKFVSEPNATYKYINADNAANPATPWDVTFGTSIDYPIKLVVYPSEIEGRRTSKYRDGTEVPTGAIKVLMKKDSFEPKQKDFIQLRGKLYKVLTIDPIAPLYESICYILTLGL